MYIEIFVRNKNPLPTAVLHLTCPTAVLHAGTYGVQESRAARRAGWACLALHVVGDPVQPPAPSLVCWGNEGRGWLKRYNVNEKKGGV